MDPNGKKEGRHEGLPFLRYNTYKDYHLMIFQAEDGIRDSFR